jgi:hypothetical protein
MAVHEEDRRAFSTAPDPQDDVVHSDALVDEPLEDPHDGIQPTSVQSCETAAARVVTALTPRRR